MSIVKGDIEIGLRAFEEVKRIFPGISDASRRLPCPKNTIRGWNEGIVPGGLYLARLHYAGADVLYILTGKRREEWR